MNKISKLLASPKIKYRNLFALVKISIICSLRIQKTSQKEILLNISQLFLWIILKLKRNFISKPLILSSPKMLMVDLFVSQSDSDIRLMKEGNKFKKCNFTLHFSRSSHTKYGDWLNPNQVKQFSQTLTSVSTQASCTSLLTNTSCLSPTSYIR